MEVYFQVEEIKVGLLKTVTFEQRLEGVEGVNHEDFWRKNVPDRGNNHYNSLKAR